METNGHLSEDDKSTILGLRQQYRKYADEYSKAAQNLHCTGCMQPEDELRMLEEAARERFEGAEKAYRSHVFEMMRKYSLVWL